MNTKQINKRRMIAFVTTPILPSAIVWESTVTMGKTPLVVLVINTSSAVSKSFILKSFS